MYHSRTKKVVSYGRRAQRVVAVYDHQRFGTDYISLDQSDFDDTSQRRQVQEPTIIEDIYSFPSKHVPATKTKQRSGKSSSPKVVGRKKVIGKDAPLRKPLGSYHANVPNSPSVPPKIHKPRVTSTKKTSPLFRKVSTISPFVDVDIVTLDEDGRQLNEERRVTKTNVQTNSIDKLVENRTRRSRRSTFVKSYAISDSEEKEDDEYVPTVKTQRKGRKISSKAAAQPNSRKGKNFLEIERRSSGAGSSTNHSDSEQLQRSKTKNAVTTIIISDSDNDSYGEPTSKVSQIVPPRAEEVHNTRTASIRSAKDRTTKIPKASLPDSPKSFNGKQNHDIVPVRERPADKVKPPPRSVNLKGSTSGSAQNRKLSSRSKPSPVTDIRTESKHHHLYPHQRASINVSYPEEAFVQKQPGRLTPSRLIVLSDDEGDSSMDEELKLALQVAEVQLSNSLPSSKPPSDKTARNIIAETNSRTKLGQTTSQTGVRQPPIPSFLRPLLSECGQFRPFDFASFIETFPADPIIGLPTHASFSGNSVSFDSFEKVGEASYSEVFGIGNVVLKIIPLLDEENDISVTWSADWDSPPVSEVQDVLKEIVVTKAMGEICKGFIKLLKAHVVVGAYPESLVTLWDKYDSKKGSESARPDRFTSKQAYAVIILPNGGPDLENFSFNPFNVMGGTGWRQACSVFWQIVRSLGQAEELVHFEHRDLHWGQILVRITTKSLRLPMRRSSGDITLDDPWHGVQSTIIDLGLARIDYGHGESFWTPFTEEIFEGEGDYQYDIYRMMRQHNEDEWQSFRPLTNVMWLYYLVDKLINSKQLRSPMRRSQSKRKSASSDLEKAIMEADERAYECLVEMEQVLRRSIVPIARTIGAKLGKGPKDLKHSLLGIDGVGTAMEVKSAVDVLHFGKLKGWIE